MFAFFSLAARSDFKVLHNALNDYHDIYIERTNLERLNTATTEVRVERKEKKGVDSGGIVVRRG